MKNKTIGGCVLSTQPDQQKRIQCNPLLHLYHFRKNYNYILANINSESSRVIFSLFFVFIQWVKHFCTPANFVTI